MLINNLIKGLTGLMLFIGKKKTAGRLVATGNISVSAREVCVLITGRVKSDAVSPTTRHRCHVSTELCCPGAKSQRRALPLVTRFGVKLESFLL